MKDIIVYRLLTLPILLCLTMVAARSSAQEPARLALLIGNKGYVQKVGALKNPHDDVALVGAALKKLNFKVTVLKDASYRDMDTALKRHIANVRQAGPRTINFFYYSGHGIANPDTQINYLIPVDVTDANDSSLWHVSFEQNDIIEKLSRQAPQATHYVVFDACRNELKLASDRTKGAGAPKGFVPVAETAGLLIAYATAPKQTASDAGVGGGPYAKLLAEELVKPGYEAVTMFRNVQIRVKQAIGQDPWLSFPALPAVYLAGQRAPDPPVTRPPSDAEIQLVTEIQNLTDPAKLEAIIRKDPDHLVALFAKARQKALKLQLTADARPVQVSAPAATPPRPAPPPPTPPATVAVPPKGAAPAPPSATPKTAMAVPKAEPAKPAAQVKPGAALDERALKPGDTFKECEACPEMVVVPSGTFTMGSPNTEESREVSEQPLRKVTIAEPFAVGKFEVTTEEYRGCVNEGACKPSERGGGQQQPNDTSSARSPASGISWDDAKAYAAWLSKKTGGPYRLLSEAEWEYAARAGTTTAYSWGSSIGSDNVNCSGCGSSSATRTVQVGQSAPNAFGLHDMHGNVWEWVEDCWHKNYEGASPNHWPRTSDGDCTRRVLRGGSWRNKPMFLRSAYRFEGKAGARGDLLGTRVARPLPILRVPPSQQANAELIKFVTDVYMTSNALAPDELRHHYCPKVDYWGVDNVGVDVVLKIKKNYYAKWRDLRYELIYSSFDATRRNTGQSSFDVAFEYWFRVVNKEGRIETGLGKAELILDYASGAAKICKEAGRVLR